MDKNNSWVIEQKVKRTIDSLDKNNMTAFYVSDEKELIEKIESIVNTGETVAVGGSQTLFEAGIIDYLRNGKYNFLDRYKEGLTPEGLKEVFRRSFFADTYLTSSNAITEKGELFNVDGNGNRVAAMLYGPDKVIVIAGINKLVKDIDEAEERVKAMAAPANNKRLNRDNPCTQIGSCVDCKNSGRICNEYVLIKRQGIKGRITVIIVGKELGY